jgi:protein farnesyltransferase/geranylgeranyltransferase type-1 subunit alpha
MHTADKDATDYFRGVMATRERSERVLELTEHIIRMNPAHYTVWFVYDGIPIIGGPDRSFQAIPL